MLRKLHENSQFSNIGSFEGPKVGFRVQNLRVKYCIKAVTPFDTRILNRVEPAQSLRRPRLVSESTDLFGSK